MIIFLLFLFAWLVGFVLTGYAYFIPRGISPTDQYWIPAIVAILWPVGLPVYHVVTRSGWAARVLRRPKGKTQEEYWEQNHNPWLD